MSSMLSAPATIPATNAGILTTVFAPADPGTVRCSATSWCSPDCSANAGTGARPAADTRLDHRKPPRRCAKLASTGCPCRSKMCTRRKSHHGWS